MPVTCLSRLARVVRGVRDPERTSAFFRWLLGVRPHVANGSMGLRCGNGELVFVEDGRPVSVGWTAYGATFFGEDPDGVPVAALEEASSTPGPVALDHVRLNCADLLATIDFYRDLGLRLTWAGGPDGEALVDGVDDIVVRGSDWVHLGAADGYLSLSQADWLDYGIHTPASGPPRFIHFGFRVHDLDDVVNRLAAESVPYTFTMSDVGRHVYLNDPDGDAAIGFNIELVQYSGCSRRSGLPAQAT